MKKITILLAAMALMATAANAQQNKTCTQPNCTPDNSTCATPKNCARNAIAFKGITLTEDQKASIAKIDQKYDGIRKAAREQARRDRKQYAKEVTADSSQMVKQYRRDNRNLRAESRQMDSAMYVRVMNDRLNYFREVQKVLTPDQYITFLENTAASAPMRPDGFGQRGPRGGKDKAQMTRGQRGGKDKAQMTRGQRGDKDKTKAAVRKGGRGGKHNVNRDFNRREGNEVRNDI